MMLGIEYLKQILESLAYQFTDFTQQIKIEVGDHFSVLSVNVVQICSDVSEYLKTNLEKIHQLRVLVDGLNHMVWHTLTGDIPRRYHEFVRSHNDCPSLALVVLNCVEDMYVNYRRLEKYPGLKKASYLHNYLLSKNVLPSVDSMTEPRDQAVVGLVHLTLVGYIDGVEKLNKEVVAVLLECKRLLKKVKKMDRYEDRKKIAEKIIQILKSLPGDSNSRVHKLLPLCVSSEIKKLVDSIINTNRLFGQSKELGDTSESVVVLPTISENDMQELKVAKNLADGPDSLLEITDTERELLQLIQEQMEQLKLQEEKIKKYGDPKYRDRLVNWNFRIELPLHIEQELYYLLYQIKTKEKYVEGSCGRFINIKNYIRYVSGDVNIQDRLFYDIGVTDIGNRAVLLVIDTSGSMKGKKLELVRLAVHILATAVSELGDRLAIFSFRGSSKGECEVTPILFWNEPYRQEYLSLLYAVGSTPLKEALLKAKEWIDDVTAREKLVIVLTDGEPTTSTPQEVRGVVENLIKRGVVVIGLGIGVKIKPHHLKECFGEKNYVWIPDLEELPRELFRVYLQHCGVVI